MRIAAAGDDVSGGSGFRYDASVRCELQSGFVENDGEQIYFESVGVGDAVVLSHGGGGNHAVWYQQVPVLAEKYRVVTWDQRGFGRSSNVKEQAGPVSAVDDLRACSIT